MKSRLPNLFLVGFLLGILYWLLESVLHTYVFGDGPIWETVFAEHDPNELWMRLLVTGLLTAFGWASERFVRSERRDKERAMKLNHLFHYIHQFSQFMGEKFQQPITERPRSELERIEASLLNEDEMGRIVQTMQELSQYLDSRIEGLYALLELTHEINKGLLVDEVLKRMYDTFRSVIPYNRIGVALLEDDGQTLTSRWMRSDDGNSRIPMGYSAPMAGSSLQRIIETGEPRIINDLGKYFKEHPNSTSTKLILDEGIRSSLTCPLIAMGKPIGFIFFSSKEVSTYRNVHSEIFKLVAGQLAVVLEKSHMYEQLIWEKEKSESLLLNVMPARIIARMKAGEENPVEEFTEVGILFADIVGFTEMARRCAAAEVAKFLREMFTQFDLLCERYGVEKVKTIGDAYMVSRGVVCAEGVCLRSLAEFALAMLETAAAIRTPDGSAIQIRVGVHSGPVIGGVIGQRKFAYDLWGDTVNLAQRLESGGVPGRIHVSQRVFSLLKEDFKFESRGEIEIKGEARMNTYFLGAQIAKPSPVDPS